MGYAWPAHVDDERRETPEARRWASAAIGLAGAAAFLFILLVTIGVRPSEALSASAVVWLNAWPLGYVWALAVRRRVSLAEFLGMGLAVSIAVVAIGNVLLASTPIGGLRWWYLPTLSALVWLVARWRGVRVGPPTFDWWEVSGPAAAVVVTLFVRMPLIHAAPIYGTEPIDRTPPDLYLFESMGNALASFGVDQSGPMADVGYRYHWFGYAWTGWLTGVIHPGEMVVLARVVPVVCALGLALLAGAWCYRVVRSRWAPLLGASCVVVAGALYGYMGSVDPWFSPSNSIGGLWLVALAISISDGIETHVRRWWWAILVLLAAATMGGKASHGIVAVGGVAMLALVALTVRRGWRRRAIIVAVLVGGSALATFLLVESGQPDSGALDLAWDPGSASTLSALYGWTAAAISAVDAFVFGWLGVGYALADRQGRTWPMTWLALGGVLISLLPAVLFSVGNSLWFPVGATIAAAPVAAAAVLLFVTRVRDIPRLPVLVILAGLGGAALAVLSDRLAASSLVDVRPYTRPLIVALVLAIGALVLALLSAKTLSLPRLTLGWAAVMGTALVICVPLLGGVQWLADGGSRSPMPRDVYEWQADAILEAGLANPEVFDDARAAAAWLRERAEPADLLAMTEPSTSWPSALSGLRLYASFPWQIENWTRQGTMQEFDRRSELVSRYVDTADEAARAQLCAEGVRWVWWSSEALTNPADRGPTTPFGHFALEALCTDSPA